MLLQDINDICKTYKDYKIVLSHRDNDLFIKDFEYFNDFDMLIINWSKTDSNSNVQMFLNSTVSINKAADVVVSGSNNQNEYPVKFVDVDFFNKRLKFIF